MVLLAGCLILAGCYPPQVQYPYTKLVHARRNVLKDNLLLLLPEEQRTLPAAREEAQWISDTAYKAAAGISRLNGSHFPGWAGNALVNARLQDRGLCWHYQHDMYRELRRRKLEFFRLGCCVRDKKERSEHNCIYVAAQQGEWPDVWVLDAWMWNGRLKVDKGTDLDQDRWKEVGEINSILSRFYVEGHRWPMEHWCVLRGKNGKYGFFYTDDVQGSAQFRRMYRNIEKGYREHPGSPMNY